MSSVRTHPLGLGPMENLADVKRLRGELRGRRGLSPMAHSSISGGRRRMGGPHEGGVFGQRARCEPVVTFSSSSSAFGANRKGGREVKVSGHRRTILMMGTVEGD